MVSRYSDDTLYGPMSWTTRWRFEWTSRQVHAMWNHDGQGGVSDEWQASVSVFMTMTHGSHWVAIRLSANLYRGLVFSHWRGDTAGIYRFSCWERPAFSTPECWSNTRLESARLLTNPFSRDIKSEIAYKQKKRRRSKQSHLYPNQSTIFTLNHVFFWLFYYSSSISIQQRR